MAGPSLPSVRPSVWQYRLNGLSWRRHVLDPTPTAELVGDTPAKEWPFSVLPSGLHRCERVFQHRVALLPHMLEFLLPGIDLGSVAH